jgi:hypothetical protein
MRVITERKLSKRIYGTSHTVSEDEAKFVIEKPVDPRLKEEDDRSCDRSGCLGRRPPVVRPRESERCVRAQGLA